MSNIYQFIELEEKIKKLEKKIAALEEYNEELENRLIRKDREFDDIIWNLTGDNFSTVSLSTDKYVRVGREGYRAGIEGANAPNQIVFWAGQGKPSTDCPYYVLADGTLHATKAFLGNSGIDADDIIDNSYFEAWVRGEVDYGFGAQLQSSGGNLILNNPTYYLYAANDLGQGFYIKKDGSAYISSGVTIGPSGSYIASQNYANTVANDAYFDATDYTENYADGTWTMIGAKLKSTDGNLVLNSTVGGVPYYLYAVKNGKGFYIDTDGNALFTGSVTGSSIYGSNFYGTGTNSGYIKVGNLGSSADLSLYRGGGSYPTFRIYDGASYIALQSRTDSSLSPITFLEIIDSTVKPYGNWNFSNASLNFSGASITGLYAKYA